MDDIMKMFLAQAAGEEAGAVPQEGVQTTGEPGTPVPEAEPVDPGAQQRSPFSNIWIPLILMMLVMYFFIFRSPRKRQQQQLQKMRESLKRNARIRTIGGIMGTVVEVRDEEVVLKIDETTGW